MKKATSYKRGQRVFTHANSSTTAGVWILELPALVADATDVKLVGQQVAQAIQASKQGVPHPTSWKGLFDPVLSLAGVKSWSTFAKSARCVGLEWETDCVSIVSTENLGADGGFNDTERNNLPAAVLSDPQALGSALLAAFEKSK